MTSAPHGKSRRTRGVCHAGSWNKAGDLCYQRARTSGHDIHFVVLYRADRRAVRVRRRGDSRNYFLCVASVAAAALCQRDRLLTRRDGVSHLSRETRHDEHGSAPDLFFYLNADTLEFLWSDYRRYVVGVLAALAAATIAAVLAWRFDTTR